MRTEDLLFSSSLCDQQSHWHLQVHSSSCRPLKVLSGDLKGHLDSVKPENSREEASSLVCALQFLCMALQVCVSVRVWYLLRCNSQERERGGRETGREGDTWSQTGEVKHPQLELILSTVPLSHSTCLYVFLSLTALHSTMSFQTWLTFLFPVKVFHMNKFLNLLYYKFISNISDSNKPAAGKTFM